MKALIAARKRRDAAIAKADALNAIAETQAWSDAERAEYDAITADIMQANADVARIEAAQEFERTAPATASFAGDGTQLSRTDVTGRVTAVHDNAAEKPWGADTGAAFGEFLQAVHRAGVGGRVDQRLMAATPGLGQNETVGELGGYLVGTDISNAIMQRVRTGEILSRVNRIPVGPNSNGVRINVLDETSRANGSRFGGVAAYWLPEGGTKIASTLNFAQIELRLKKLAALGYATDELLQDATALEAVMIKAFAEEIRFKTEDAIVEGTGVGQPLGILNSPALITVSKVTGQAADTVEAANVQGMWARLDSGSRSNAVWLINQQVEPLLQDMTISLGTAALPVYLPAGGYSTAPYGTLFGRPVIPVEYGSAPGDVGDIILADLSQYALIDKGGIKNDTSIHVAFTTDETCFRAVYRVDGQPMWRSALTPFKGSVTTSPFVTLAAR